MMIKRTLALSALLTCVLALPAAGQQRFGPSVEATFGLGTGGGGTFVERGGAAVDAVIALPLAQTSAGTFVAGMAWTGNGKMTSELVCVVGPNDGCIPEYPVFLSLGVLAGVQRPLGRSMSARLLAGPAYFQAVDGGDTFGAQGRVDVARPLAFRTAIVASVRGAVLPNYDGEMLRFASFGLGFRIQ